MISESSADRGESAKTDDLSGNLTKSQDANGNQATHSYDLLNRKVKTTWSDGKVATYSYDNCNNGIGRLCQLTDSSGSTTYTYNSEGQVTRKVQSIADTLLIHSYTYTADGKLQSETLPSGNVVSYNYALDKLTSISLNGQLYLSQLTYTATGQVASWQWADGSVYRKTYDANGRVKTFPLGNTVRTLSYDAVGNITGWSDSSDATKAQRFGYNVLGRLTGYAATNESQSFQYDANGNHTAKTDNGVNTLYGIQTNSNCLVSAGNQPQTLDANGNLLNDGVHTYTYNAQNRLVSVDGTTTYTYNAEGQRVKKVSGQTTIFYAWDNDRIIGEYVQGANGLQASETIYMGSTPIALIQQGQTYHIHADQIDTGRVLSDASGKILWSWEGKPFGETKPNEDPDQDGVALRYNQRFAGQTYDVETGLHYNFHRDYNPQTGRYVQSDPIGLEGGLNAFGYVEGNPLSISDLLGWAPTYIAGTLNRAIDVYLDIHNTGADVTNAISIMRKLPKIKFTAYIYGQNISSTTGLRNGGAKVIGLHITTSDTVATINSFYNGVPASIHGSATNRLSSTVMGALRAKNTPFVRAAGDRTITGDAGSSPSIRLSFSGGHTISAIQKNSSITHYFVHPNETSGLAVLTYFNQNAK